MTRPSLHALVGSWLRWLCLLLALFGGVMLVAIAGVTLTSIAGRALIPVGLSPLAGDYELVEMGAAVAVFSFLPWCQFNRGHVTVDIFVNVLPDRLRAVLTLVGDLALGLAAAVILWRLWLGLGEKLSYGETTFILGLPVWYGYALSVVGAGLFVLAAVYSVWTSLRAVAGIEALPRQATG